MVPLMLKAVSCPAFSHRDVSVLGQLTTARSKSSRGSVWTDGGPPPPTTLPYGRALGRPFILMKGDLNL